MRQELNTHPLELSQEVSDKTYFIMKKGYSWYHRAVDKWKNNLERNGTYRLDSKNNFYNLEGIPHSNSSNIHHRSLYNMSDAVSVN